MLPKRLNVFTDTAYPVCRQDRQFYFFLLSLSLTRKARNAIIKLPKVANKVNTPMKIEIISNAVILRTSLPMYFQQAGQMTREATSAFRSGQREISISGHLTPCHGYSLRKSTLFRWLVATFNIISYTAHYFKKLVSLLLLYADLPVHFRASVPEQPPAEPHFFHCIQIKSVQNYTFLCPPCILQHLPCLVGNKGRAVKH